MIDQTGGADRIDLLRTFLRIVEAGTLSAAAQHLGTSQPTVSRRLQLLERMLGVRLLQRSTHGLALTEDGERCLAHTRELLDSWGAMEAELRGAQDRPRGLLRVQAPHAFGQEQLVAPLAEYLRAHPEVSVEWKLHDRSPDFIADGIDCAIRVGWIEDPSVVAIRLAEVPRIVVAAPGLRGDRPPPAEAAELAGLPWLALTTYYRDEVVLSHAGRGEEQRFPIRPRLGTDSLHALRAAALAGLGAAIVSAWIVADDLREGRLEQLVPDWTAAPLPVFLICPAGRFRPAKLRHFIELMRGCMSNVVGMAPARG
ncbi:LysR family transcriptional regulator [Rhodovastum atsumiense]|uniref:LysR family transcriptional regulator n=1 Tax=Rhodovastum atsumiense TaxID=504468 RepID=A0A5M6IK27_9PROT|nr:LysR family transcriptional regulator [Rhodovastum atsumiense]KAA5608209.1 LysR family transcriptional regulator [Rhodovastum atsumiense]CAH2602278.1 LysR family transcriptional regulator [Rhodovastum atsumiense]